jgi:hypothetical protein
MESKGRRQTLAPRGMPTREQSVSMPTLSERAQLLGPPRTSIEVRRPQPSTQQLMATENVQRQITLMVVIVMEEARFRLPIQERVHGIQTHKDGSRRFPMGLQKERDQQFVDGRARIGNLVVALGCGGTGERQFQAVQSTFTGEHSPRSPFPANIRRLRCGSSLQRISCLPRN